MRSSDPSGQRGRDARMPPPPPPPLIHSRRSGAFAKPPRRSWPPDRWDPLLVRHGMPRSSPRKADLQPGLRSWAYDLPQRAGASSGAPKRWLAADAATFASIYAELPPEERHAYEVLEASRGCHLYFDLDGRRGGAPGSMACEPPCPRPSPSHPVTCDRAPEQPGEDTARCVAEEAAGVLRDLIAAQAPAGSRQQRRDRDADDRVGARGAASSRSMCCRRRCGSARLARTCRAVRLAAAGLRDGRERRLAAGRAAGAVLPTHARAAPPGGAARL